jgi:hypothetical protein
VPSIRIPRLSFLLFAFALFVAGLPAATHASIYTLSFFRLTNNASVDIAGQLQVDFMDQASAASLWSQSIDSDEVLFVIKNNVGVSSNIGEVYFDDGTILRQSRIINSLAGYTNYTGSMHPSNLPGGNTASPPFVATAGFGADTSGNPANGVNTAADALGIVIELLPGLNFDDVVTAIGNGDLRVGLHLRSIGQQSDSFINHPEAHRFIPEPGSAAIWALGVLAIAGLRRRERRLT